MQKQGESSEREVPVRRRQEHPVSVVGTARHGNVLIGDTAAAAMGSPGSPTYSPGGNRAEFFAKKNYQPNEVLPQSPDRNKPISILNGAVIAERAQQDRRYGQRRTWEGPPDEPEKSEFEKIMEYRNELVARGGNKSTVPYGELTRKVHDVRDAISKEEVERGIHKFQQIDQDKSGDISYEEFLSVLGKADHAALQGLFNMFDRDGSGQISLEEFTRGLKEFSTIMDRGA